MANEYFSRVNATFYGYTPIKNAYIYRSVILD